MRTNANFWLIHLAVLSLVGGLMLGCGDLDESECDPEVTENCVCDENDENCMLIDDNNGTNNGAPTSIEVTFFNFAFSPRSDFVAEGGTITFINNDESLQHAPLSTPSGIDVSGLNPGEQTTVSAPPVGEYDVTDRINPEVDPFVLTVVAQ